MVLLCGSMDEFVMVFLGVSRLIFILIAKCGVKVVIIINRFEVIFLVRCRCYGITRWECDVVSMDLLAIIEICFSGCIVIIQRKFIIIIQLFCNVLLIR